MGKISEYIAEFALGIIIKLNVVTKVLTEYEQFENKLAQVIFAEENWLNNKNDCRSEFLDLQHYKLEQKHRAPHQRGIIPIS